MRPPDLAETPTPFDDPILERAGDTLALKFAAGLGEDGISLSALDGEGASALICKIGSEERAHVFEFLCRGNTPGIEGRLGVLLDFLDGALSEFFEAERDAGFAIDWVGHPFGEGVVFARSQLRDFAAERWADELLGDG